MDWKSDVSGKFGQFKKSKESFHEFWIFHIYIFTKKIRHQYSKRRFLELILINVKNHERSYHMIISYDSYEIIRMKNYWPKSSFLIWILKPKLYKCNHNWELRRELTVDSRQKQYNFLILFKPEFKEFEKHLHL